MTTMTLHTAQMYRDANKTLKGESHLNQDSVQHTEILLNTLKAMSISFTLAYCPVMKQLLQERLQRLVKIQGSVGIEFPHLRAYLDAYEHVH